MLGTHKSERLERYIIALIAVELLLSLYEMAKKMRDKQVATIAAETALRVAAADASAEYKRFE